jgi:hypothetical protein
MIEVYNMDAEVVATVDAAGVHSISVPAGIYLVSGENDSRKVVIK